MQLDAKVVDKTHAMQGTHIITARASISRDSSSVLSMIRADERVVVDKMDAPAYLQTCMRACCCGDESIASLVVGFT
jgi:hypothetical protein